MLIYSRPITRDYHANRASCASCWSACYILLLMILPYVLAIAMGAFWTKDAFEREQPGVRFRHEVLVEGHLIDGTAIGWSTSDQLNTALGERLRPCQLRAWPEDTDRDGKPEALQFSLKVPLDADGGERLHGLTVLLGLEAVYASDRFADLRLNGSVLVAHQSGLAGARWRQHADVGLRTSSPLRPASLEPRKPCASPFWLLQQPLSLDGQPTTAEVKATPTNPITPSPTLTLTLTPKPERQPQPEPLTPTPNPNPKGRGGPVRRVQRDARARGAAPPVDPWRHRPLRAPPHTPRAERAHRVPTGRARSAQVWLGPIPSAGPAHLLDSGLGARSRHPARRADHAHARPTPPDQVQGLLRPPFTQSMMRVLSTACTG